VLLAYFAVDYLFNPQIQVSDRLVFAQMGHLGEKKAYQIYKLLFARSLAFLAVKK